MTTPPITISCCLDGLDLIVVVHPTVQQRPQPREHYLFIFVVNTTTTLPLAISTRPTSHINIYIIPLAELDHLGLTLVLQ